MQLRHFICDFGRRLGAHIEQGKLVTYSCQQNLTIFETKLSTKKSWMVPKVHFCCDEYFKRTLSDCPSDSISCTSLRR